MEKCILNLNGKKKELQPHGTTDFPCAVFCENHSDESDDFIPWHWHEEIELIYVAQGNLNVKIPGQSFYLHEGQTCFINSNILHFAKAEPSCILHSLVFHPSLITGSRDSVFSKKYILPLTQCASLAGCLLGNQQEDCLFSTFFSNAYEAMTHRHNGYEFVVRDQLSALLVQLVLQEKGKIEQQVEIASHDSLRINMMLEFIHQTFQENLSLGDIAKSANISERECLRCFQRAIHESPMQYLLKYRIMQAAIYLVQDPLASISKVAISCGFDSHSNFSKIFKRYFNCTPKEYRKHLSSVDIRLL